MIFHWFFPGHTQTAQSLLYFFFESTCTPSQRFLFETCMEIEMHFSTLFRSIYITYKCTSLRVQKLFHLFLCIYQFVLVFLVLFFFSYSFIHHILCGHLLLTTFSNFIFSVGNFKKILIVYRESLSIIVVKL